MGIPYKITCDRCGAQYPEEFDSEIYQGISFGMSPNDFALEIREEIIDNNWFITVDNKILCPICDAITDFDADEAEKGATMLQACDNALELDPNNSSAWYNKGFALSKLGRYEEALQAWDKALELDPDNSDVWAGKGLVLGKLGRYEEAQIAFKKASELQIKP